ncbi:SDR family oxidoreductase [Candidatus Saccharibacteria bacterium]|nr:MAG: SDR family oxidoreductase [Candidatus Saccharibacteria bacterium]
MNIPISQLIDLSHKTAVITGGAMGIGEAIVRRLHEAGANVVIGDLAQEQMDALAGELNGLRTDSAATWHCDVSKAEDIEALLKVAQDNFGSVDILVNNAGIYPLVKLADMDEAQFSKVLDVNLKGVFFGTKQAAAMMKEQGTGGSIVTVCSIDSLHPSAVGLAAYDASKHGVWGFLKNAALELAEDNIRVNGIAPGGVSTPGTHMGEMNQDLIEQFTALIPMKRFGDPDEMGRVALFLASDLSSYLTGSLIVADGGRLLR